MIWLYKLTSEVIYVFTLQSCTESVTPTKSNLDGFGSIKTYFLQLIQQFHCFTQKGAPQLRGLRNVDLKCAELHGNMMENS